MATELGHSPVRVPRQRVSLLGRVYGLGSVYAKSLRDSRLSFIIVNLLIGGLMFIAGAGVGKVYTTPGSRQGLARLAAELTNASPMLAGLIGNPVNVGTVGGYVNWKYGPVFIYVACIWSIIALSGMLAGEARRGSLDLIAATPLSRRRLAVEKVAAHLTAMTVTVLIATLAAWLMASAFGTLAGDRIPFPAALDYGIWLGLMALACGSVAFVLAPFLGRSGSAGVAGLIFIAGYLLNGYKAAIPALGGVAHATWFDWTANNIPLAGRYDWASMIPVALLIAVLLALGVEAFARRDLGETASLEPPPLPGVLVGLGDPVRRSFGDRLPSAAAWGLGLGFFGLVMAAASRAAATALAGLPADTLKVFRTLLPGYTVTTAGGFLQLVFVEIGFILVGFAAAMLVSGWASDETSGRLEMLLSTPLSRWRWALSSAAGVFLAVAVMTVLLAAGIGIGARAAGSDVGTPMAGTIVLGLYAAAVAGFGFAAGGVLRTSVAGPVASLVVVVTFLIGLVGPALTLPGWVTNLALTQHLGKPMIGSWDTAGIIACLVIALGGAAIGALGMMRRDIRH